MELSHTDPCVVLHICVQLDDALLVQGTGDSGRGTSRHLFAGPELSVLSGPEHVILASQFCSD